MSITKIVSGRGFNKQSAFDGKAAFQVKFDASIAWKKAGSPVGEEFKAFATEYLAKKVKSAAGIGCVVVVSPGVEDNRERPYTTDVVTTEGKRKYKTVYQVVEDSTKRILGEKDKKSQSLKLAKDLVSQLKTDVTVYPAKIVSEGEKVAATVKYTPSVNAKEGSYMFFGIEAE